jgi:hypothetical protein
MYLIVRDTAMMLALYTSHRKRRDATILVHAPRRRLFSLERV